MTRRRTKGDAGVVGVAHRGDTTVSALKRPYVLGLVVVLGLQAALSIRLEGRNTAFIDEGSYLWAGHLELSSLFHGGALPPLSTYFSGAPIIYPPLAATANSLGGLAAARTLSTVFMLAATVFLWATTSRLFTRRAGLVAALLWALLGPTLMLGAFATYDAMSITLLAMSVWLTTLRRGQRDFAVPMLAAAIALVLANATCYSTLLFDPIVLAVSIIGEWSRTSRQVVMMRGTAFACYVLSGLVLLYLAGGAGYSTGLRRTVVQRAIGSDSAASVLWHAWGWTAVTVLASCIGLIVAAVGTNRRNKLLLLVLTVAGVLVPLEQAHIHTIESLSKHAAVGAWFSACAGGYGLDRLSRLPRSTTTKGVAVGLVGLAGFLPLSFTVRQSDALYQWPSSSRFTALLGPLAQKLGGPILVETPSAVRYYLENTIRWERWSDTSVVTLLNGSSEGSVANVRGAGKPAIYRRFITAGYFSLVALNSLYSPTLDRVIRSDINVSGKYRYLTTVPYGSGSYIVWERNRQAGRL